MGRLVLRHHQVLQGGREYWLLEGGHLLWPGQLAPGLQLFDLVQPLGSLGRRVQAAPGRHIQPDSRACLAEAVDGPANVLTGIRGHQLANVQRHVAKVADGVNARGLLQDLAVVEELHAEAGVVDGLNLGLKVGGLALGEGGIALELGEELGGSGGHLLHLKAGDAAAGLQLSHLLPTLRVLRIQQQALPCCKINMTIL